MNAEEFEEIIQKIRNNEIEILNLTNESITPFEAVRIAEALQNNTSLTEIDLSRNRVGDKGAVAIAEALKNNTFLTKIDLSRNGVGNEGVAAIAEALENNTSLNEINVSSTVRISKSLLNIIQTRLVMTPVLRNIRSKFNIEFLQAKLDLLKEQTRIGYVEDDLRKDKKTTENIKSDLVKSMSNVKSDVMGIHKKINNSEQRITNFLKEEVKELKDKILGQNENINSAESRIDIVSQTVELHTRKLLIEVNNFEQKIKVSIEEQINLLEKEISEQMSQQIMSSAKILEDRLNLEKRQKDIKLAKYKMKVSEKINARQKEKIEFDTNHSDVISELEKILSREIMYTRYNLPNNIKIKNHDIETPIAKILDLIAEGNDKISGGEEEAILVMGRTGSGKSTLTNLLAGRKLKAVVDDDVGRLMIEAVDADNSIKISHDKSAETKVPNKCVGNDSVNNVVVWDCPGFNDTDVIQEIANGFYIKKLFSQHKKLKFILAVSEPSIVDNRGVAFIEIVKQFSKSFVNAENILQSLSLVITGSKKQKQIEHLANELKNILEQNKNLDIEIKKIIESLKEKIVLFHAPEKKGELPGNDILKTIYRMTEYTNTEEEQGDIALSNNAIEYCNQLIKESLENINSVFTLLSLGCADPSNFNNYSEDNVLYTNYALIKSYIPKDLQSKFDLEKEKQRTDCYNIYLKQIKLQIDLLQNIPETLEELFVLARGLFKIFAEYSVQNQNQSEMIILIQKYEYFLFQQKDYVEMLSHLIKQDNPIKSDEIKLCMEQCNDLLKTVYHKELLDLEISQEENVDYYIEIISHLEQYKQECKEQLYIAYKKLGDLSRNDKKLDQLDSYLQALEYKKDDEDVYSKLGDVYKADKNYKKAIEYYWSINDVIEIEECFDKWIQEEPRNHVIREYRGDVNAAVGNFAKSVECYNRAKSLNKMPEYEAIIRKKITACQDQEYRHKYIESYKIDTELGAYLIIDEVKDLSVNSENWYLNDDSSSLGDSNSSDEGFNVLGCTSDPDDDYEDYVDSYG